MKLTIFRIRANTAISPPGLQRFGRERDKVGTDAVQPDVVLLYNQPVDDYGRCCIIVFNTPGTNANTVAQGLYPHPLRRASRGFDDRRKPGPVGSPLQ